MRPSPARVQLTADARRRAQEQLRAELERRETERLRQSAANNFLHFVRYTSPGYLAGWVHEDICRRLEQFSADVAAGRSPRLIIALPPRAGKTHLVSQRFPIWHLGRNPYHEVVCASYGQELADDNSRTAREVARGEEANTVFPDLRPKAPEKRHYADYRRADVDRVNHWRVGTGGSYKAVGVGGPLTGRGAHILIIDDPFKDWEEADSAARRRLVWDWYTSTAYTRLAPGGGVIVMATRWHQEDLTGLLLEAQRKGEGDTWDVVVYPAIAEVDEPHRKAGEALHPARYPIERLGAIRRAVGLRKWLALYQQRPTAAEGTLFRREWMHHFDYDPQRPPGGATWDRVVVSIDATFGRSDTSDFVVMQVWAKKGPRAYLLDQVRDRMTYPETRAAVRTLRAKWLPWARVILIETKANGQALIDELGAEVPGVIGYNPEVSKDARASVVAVYFEAGNVVLPSAAYCPWVHDYVEELVAFGGGVAHDDQVDATSQALLYLFSGSKDPTEDLDRQLGWLKDAA